MRISDGDSKVADEAPINYLTLATLAGTNDAVILVKLFITAICL